VLLHCRVRQVPQDVLSRHLIALVSQPVVREQRGSQATIPQVTDYERLPQALIVVSSLEVE